MLLLMKKITLFLSALLLSASLVVPAFAASPYDGLAVANVKNEPLNMRTGPSTDADIIGKCYRGCGGTVLERKNGWTRIHSGKLEGWLKDDYLLYGTDIKPLAQEMGLLSASVTAVTLNIREDPSTDAAIIKQAAQGEAFPVSSTSEGWIKIQLPADTYGYICAEYAKISPVQVKPLMQKKRRLLFIPLINPRKNLLISFPQQMTRSISLLPAQQWKQEMVPTMSSWPLQAVLSIVSSQSNGDRVFPVSSMQMGSFPAHIPVC